ncbi:MAG TPA: hypothetical protein VH374_23110 [Polyangia bacterium]|nr:hypothetical protein [Polyangia bacterium]
MKRLLQRTNFGWASGIIALLVLVWSGCGPKGARDDFAGHAVAVTTALEQVRALAQWGAQATECAFTVGARQPPNRDSRDKQKLIRALDAAEGATGASDRAAGEFVHLNEQCRQHWGTNCDYLIARIANFVDSAKERVAAACSEATAARPDGGPH